jgi:hypothetical protein
MSRRSSRIETSSPEDLVGRSIGNLVIAGFFTLFTLTFVLIIGLGRSDLGTLLFPAAVLGSASGFFVVGAGQSCIVVRHEQLTLVNMFREIRVHVEAIYSLELASGIYVVLKDGRWYTSTAFNPALGKRLFTRNLTARRFGEAAAAVLGVSTDAGAPKQVISLEPDSIGIRIRLETVAYMLLFAMLSCGIALGSRNFS